MFKHADVLTNERPEQKKDFGSKVRTRFKKNEHFEIMMWGVKQGLMVDVEKLLYNWEEEKRVRVLALKGQMRR